MSDTPNPGSDEALEMGCECPVMDNHRGMFAPYPPDGWWMTPGCPVHMDVEPAPVASSGQEDER